MDAIIKYLLEKSPELALIVIAAIGAWKLSKVIQELKNKNKDLEGSISNLEDSVSEIKSDVSDIKLFITSKYPTALGVFASKCSPMQLNEHGKKLLEACSGILFLDANQVLLFSEIEKRNPKTALDVEISAKDVLMSLTNDDIFNGLKVWVYNSPSWDIDGRPYTIALSDICFVLSIPLRDRYLESHTEIAK